MATKQQEDKSKTEVRNSERLKALKDRLAEVKQDKVLGNRSISTGSLFIDLNINPKQPGLRCGKAHVVAGRPGAGKTSFCLSIARALLAKNKTKGPGQDPAIVIYIDVENGMDDGLLHLYGFTRYATENFEFKVTNSGPEVLSLIEKIIVDFQGYDGEVLIIVDSIPHLSYVSEKEPFTDYKKTSAVAQGPNKLKTFFRENKARLANTNICLVLLTFMTANIGRKTEYEPQYILSGGSFLEYAADVAIELSAKGSPREMEIPPPSSADAPKKQAGLGKFQDVNFRFIKNKSAAKMPFQYTLCLVPDENYKAGIQDLSLMVNYAVDKRVVDLAGSWIRYNGSQWQGKAKFKDALKEAARAARDGVELSDPAVSGLHEKLYRDVRARILQEHNIVE